VHHLVGKLQYADIDQGVRAVRAVVSVVRDGVHVLAIAETYVAGQHFAGSAPVGRQVAFCGAGLLLLIGPSHNHAVVIVSVIVRPAILRWQASSVAGQASSVAGHGIARAIYAYIPHAPLLKMPRWRTLKVQEPLPADLAQDPATAGVNSQVTRASGGPRALQAEAIV
jgi:hypothetical protein